mmetsp:Transcript_4494/g.16629  ORF Transcript_4494/g.16629 Transcript_4494/m.16629 type:complete len:270 (-) Transcript_4494:786-1595(-)
MADPFVATDGQSYDRAGIERWFLEGHQTSPTTGAALPHTSPPTSPSDTSSRKEGRGPAPRPQSTCMRWTNDPTTFVEFEGCRAAGAGSSWRLEGTSRGGGFIRARIPRAHSGGRLVPSRSGRRTGEALREPRRLDGAHRRLFDPDAGPARRGPQVDVEDGDVVARAVREAAKDARGVAGVIDVSVGAEVLEAEPRNVRERRVGLGRAVVVGRDGEQRVGGDGTDGAIAERDVADVAAAGPTRLDVQGVVRRADEAQVLEEHIGHTARDL